MCSKHPTCAMILSLILSLSVGHDAAGEPQLVKVAGDPYPPWALGEENMDAKGGIAVDIVAELSNRLGLQSRAVVYPFKRGLERIKNGEEDLILMVSRSAEREQFMSFTVPIREVRFVFYHLTEMRDFGWDQWSDLKPYRIGIVTGQNIGDEWKSAIKEHDLKVEEVKADTFNIEKLLLGRVDIIVADQEVMQRIIEDNAQYHGRLTWFQRPVFESVNNLGISKKSFLATRLSEINDVLETMKADGTFHRIFCAYGKSFQGTCEK